MSSFDDLPAAAGGGSFDDLPDVIEAATPKTKIGAMQAGRRSLMKTYADTANLLAMAGGGAVSLVEMAKNALTGGDGTDMRDAYFGNVVEATRGAQKYWDTDQQTEELTTGGKAGQVVGQLAGILQQALAAGPLAAETVVPIAGARGAVNVAGAKAADVVMKSLPTIVQKAAPTAARGALVAQPTFAQPGALTRTQDLIDAGVDEGTAAATGAVNLLTNTAMGAMPAAAAGGLAKRALTGAAINVPTGAAGRAAENLVLGDEYERHQQAAFGEEGVGMDAGIGAIMGALFGPRAAAARAAPAAAPAIRPDPELIVAENTVTPSLSLADVIAQAVGAPTVAQATPKKQQDGRMVSDADRERQQNVADARAAFAPGNADTPIVRRSDVIPDEQARESMTVPGKQAPEFVRDATGTAVTSEKNAELSGRRGALTDEQVSLIADKTGLSVEEIRRLSPESQQRIYDKQAAVEQQTTGTLRTSFEGSTDGQASPASKPDVPGDRMGDKFGVTEEGAGEVRAARTEDDYRATPDPAAVKQRDKMLGELDSARKQLDALRENERYAELKRKARDGELDEKQGKELDKLRAQEAKLDDTVYGLEGKIYDLESRTEAGSQTHAGTSDRPFRDSSSPTADDLGAWRGNPDAQVGETQAQFFERRSREGAARQQREMHEKLMREWEARQKAQRERERQRQQQEDAEQERQRRAREQYQRQRTEQEQARDKAAGGKKAGAGVGFSDKAASRADGAPFSTDQFGFVLSDKGGPILFKHQRDAGWWILRTGNKANTGQVFQIANHPSGKGFTVEVTKTTEAGGGKAQEGAAQGAQGGAVVPAKGEAAKGASKPPAALPAPPKAEAKGDAPPPPEKGASEAPKAEAQQDRGTSEQTPPPKAEANGADDRQKVGDGLQHTRTAGEWTAQHAEELISRFNYPPKEAADARENARQPDWVSHQDFLESALERGDEIPQRVIDDYRASGRAIDAGEWPLLSKLIGDSKGENKQQSAEQTPPPKQESKGEKSPGAMTLDEWMRQPAEVWNKLSKKNRALGINLEKHTAESLAANTQLPELRELAEFMGVAMGGTKGEVAQRIMNRYEQRKTIPKMRKADLEGMKVADLRELAKSLGINGANIKKADLVDAIIGWPVRERQRQQRIIAEMSHRAAVAREAATGAEVSADNIRRYADDILWHAPYDSPAYRGAVDSIAAQKVVPPYGEVPAAITAMRADAAKLDPEAAKRFNDIADAMQVRLDHTHRLMDAAGRGSEVKPIPERLADADVRDVFSGLPDEAGWAEVGGKAITDTAGEVIGKTRWIPNAEWWPEKPAFLTESNVREVVRKALENATLTGRERAAAEFLLEVAERRVKADREYQQMAEQMGDNQVVEIGANIGDMAEFASRLFGDRYEAVMERLAIAHEDDAAFAAALKKEIENEQQRQAGSGGDGSGEVRSEANAGIEREPGADAVGNRPDEQARPGDGGAGEVRGGDAAGNGGEQQSRPDFGLEGYDSAELARRDAERAAADDGQLTKEQIDREAGAAFSLEQQSQPSPRQAPTGGQSGLFTPDGRPTVAAEGKGPIRPRLEAIIGDKSVPDDLRRLAKMHLDAVKEASPGALENARKFADQVEGRGGSGAGTLHSNPFFDPQVWRDAARNAGYAVKVIADTLHKAFGWSLDHSGAFGRGIKELAADIKAAGSGDNALGVAGRVGRMVFDSYGGDIRALGQRYKSATFDGIVRKFVMDAADTSGQGLTVSQRIDTEWVRRIAPVGRALDAVEKAIAGMSDADKAKAMQRVADLVRNPTAIRRGTPIHDAAAAIRKTLDETLAYLREAGVEVGEVKDGYYPREFDADAIATNGAAFVAAAERAYRDTGMSQADARAAAQELHDSLIYRVDSIFKAAVGKPQAAFLKGRTFGKEIDNPSHPMHRFLVHDPAQSLAAYMQRAVRRAELARAIGDGPEQWAEWRKKMIAEGVDASGLEQLAVFVQTVGGMRGEASTSGTERFVSWARTIGAMAMLEKATLSSLTEIIVPVIRSADLRVAYSVTATTLKKLFVRHSKDVATLTPLMEDLGLISSHFSEQMLINRWGGDSPASAMQTKMLDRFFSMTGLTQWTEATRYGAVEAGRIFARRMAKSVDAGDKWAQIHTESLGELGIPPAKAKAFSKWLLSARDGLPTMTEIQAAPQEMRDAYRTLLTKFSMQSVMHPDKTTRPRWMNSPFGSVVGQLQSYNYAFWSNVIKPNVKRALRTGDYGIVGRARLAAPLLMMPLLVGGAFVVGELRDALLGDPERVAQKTAGDKLITAASRGLPVAPVDPLVNAVANAKYSRTFTESMSGPVLGTYGRLADSAIALKQKNSTATNTAERAFAKNVYDAIVEPAASIALAYGYGNAGGVAGRAAFVAARQIIGAGGFRDEGFVTPIAGEPVGKRRRSNIGGNN